MHTGVRRSPDPALVKDAAHRKPAARPAPPPVARSVSATSAATVSAVGAATRGDALGAILARAVAERAQGGSGMARQPGATLQRFLGLGKKKKPPRPAQALPAPPRPKQALPRPDRPKQPLPPSAAASPSIVIPGGVPQAPAPFEARQFDMDPFEARRFNLDAEAPPIAPPPPAARPNAPATDAPIDDGFAPELVPDASGLIPVAGNPYLEWLVSSYASDRGVMTPRSYGALRNLQVIASLRGHPKPRPIDPRYLAPTSTAYDWGFAY
jgi:hypothetical protein